MEMSEDVNKFVEILHEAFHDALSSNLRDEEKLYRLEQIKSILIKTSNTFNLDLPASFK